MHPAPEFDAEMGYVCTGNNRPIRIYKSIETRYIMEDMFTKITRFAQCL